MIHQIGTTSGLTSDASKVMRQAEQIYVRLTDPKFSCDGKFPIEIDAMVGYSSIASMRLTRSQARDLKVLLNQALLETMPLPKGRSDEH